MKTVNFTEMKKGNKEDYLLLEKHEKKFIEGTEDRLIKFKNVLFTTTSIKNIEQRLINEKN